MADNLNNEQMMLKLVKAGADDKEIMKEFGKRYKGEDKEYVAKRVTVYKRIANKQLEADKAVKTKTKTKGIKGGGAAKTRRKTGGRRAEDHVEEDKEANSQ